MIGEDGRRLPDAAELLDAALEGSEEMARPLLRLTEGRDVVEDAHHTAAPILRIDGGGGDEGPEDLPVGPPEVELAPVRPTALQRLHSALGQRPVIFVVPVDEPGGSTHQVCGVDAEQLPRRPVGHEDPPVRRVDHEDRFAEGLEYGAEEVAPPPRGIEVDGLPPGYGVS